MGIRATYVRWSAAPAPDLISDECTETRYGWGGTGMNMKVKTMLMNSQLATGGPLFDGNAARFPALLPSVRRRASQLRRPDQHRSHQAAWLYDRRGAEQIEPAVEISPVRCRKSAALRRGTAWPPRSCKPRAVKDRVSLSSAAPLFWPLRPRRATRWRYIRRGSSPIEAARRPRKLTFVPAGHEYYEWQEPRSSHPHCAFLFRSCQDANAS